MYLSADTDHNTLASYVSDIKSKKIALTGTNNNRTKYFLFLMNNDELNTLLVDVLTKYQKILAYTISEIDRHKLR